MNKLKIWKNDEGFCPVYLTERGTKVVNGRELWQALGLKTRYADWIKQCIQSHGLIERADYYTFQEKLKREDSRGASVKTEYIIKLESAKHIAMATMTEAGERVRDYFLWCEKVKDEVVLYTANQMPQITQTHLETARQLVAALETVEVLQPKADFYDAVTQSESELDMHEAVKILNLGFGRNIMFTKLREAKVFMRDNVPYQEYVDAGYFRLVETSFVKPSGRISVGKKPVVTQKGLDFLRRKFAA